MIFCDICKKNTNFISHRDIPNRKCSECKSLERHRNLFKYLENKNLIRNKKILHIAPEKCLVDILNQESHTYISIDKTYQKDRRFMSKLDITDLSIFSNDYFDLVICFHVMEHIQNDILAISEIKRIIRNSGIMILSVPISGESTYTWPEEKINLEKINQSWGIPGKYDGHYRTYGYKDLTSLLNKYFFSIELSDNLMTSEGFFICTK
jgi:predicted SAM-dependent methyltransferase